MTGYPSGIAKQILSNPPAKMDILNELDEARGGATVYDYETGNRLGPLYELAAAEIRRLRLELRAANSRIHTLLMMNDRDFDAAEVQSDNP